MKTHEPGTPGPSAGARTDGEILRACQAGDDEAFGELVERYHARAYWVAFGLVGNQEEARDVTQDAFLRVYRALARFDFNQSFYTWLYRIVVNLAIDRLRKLSKARAVAIEDVGEPASDEVDTVPERGIESNETAREVREVLATLPEKYRTVMTLRELNGLSCKEIARIVGSSHATVRWRLHMARKFFKEAWERRERRSTVREPHHEM
jgi:RNA polymerase sigma-70 factor (ECF subfamily)